jgi:hypothetical protein
MRITIYIYLLAISILAGCGTAQQFISTTSKNQVVKAKNGSDMLLGNCTRSCLLQKLFPSGLKKTITTILLIIHKRKQLENCLRKNI